MLRSHKEDNLREFLKRHQASIIVSVISTCLFLYFLQPILEFTAGYLLGFFSLLGSKYTDRIYTQVAQLETFDYSFGVFVIVLGSATAFSIGLSAGLLRRRCGTNDKETVEKIQRSSTSKRFLVVVFTSTLLLSLVLALVVVGNYAQLSLISSFNQHMRILAPYLDDQAEEELISEWSSMRSKADYDSLYEKLHQISQKNSVDLPPNKVYSPFSI